MSKYINYTNFLKDYFDISTSYEEFTKDKKITFICKESGHTNVLSSTSFGNKKAKVDISDFCQGCKDETENQEKTEKYKQEILERLGHTLLQVDFKSRKAIYICGNCGEKNETFTQNLNKDTNTGMCGKCQNDKNRKDYNELKKEIEDHGYKLLTKKEDYKTNKQKLNVLCKCGEPHSSILSDLKRDKCCQKCKLKKYEDTCMEKYGVKNVSNYEEFRLKIVPNKRQHFQEKYGVNNWNQVPELYEEQKYSSFKFKEYVFPSGRIEYIQGYENFSIDKCLEEGIHEDNIVVKNIPTFSYIFEEEKHVYYPDFIIKDGDENIIVETKSIYTYESQLKQNKQKFKSVIENKNKLRLMIYDKKEKLIFDKIFENGDEIEISL